ncbi:MAG: 30S ribosomal protein S18 [Chloroflexi bacterium]|nr:30S ribosomal protein S18 [Chloroflexota bacterium]
MVQTQPQPPQPQPGGARKRWDRSKYVPKRKVCAFCKDKVQCIDYKNVSQLRPYISDRGKIEPRRKTGACARHQRLIASAIKRAREIVLVPYVPGHIRRSGGAGLRD